MRSIRKNLQDLGFGWIICLGGAVFKEAGICPGLGAHRRQRQFFGCVRSSEGGVTDFPSGAVDKSPPTNAGATGLIPGPGRSHVLRNK